MSDRPVMNGALEISVAISNLLGDPIMQNQFRNIGRQESVNLHGSKADETLPNLAIDKKNEQCKLEFDTVFQGRSEIIRSVTLPDCGKLTRYTEPLDGRDGNSGFNVLRGYKLDDGTLIEKDLHHNTDGTISVLDLNTDNRHPDRHEVRLSESDFVKWVMEQTLP